MTATTAYANRTFNVNLAADLDEKSAMFIHQLHYWLNRPKMGLTIQGVRYIHNTYESWTSTENFPHWTLRTVQRVVKKLREQGVILIERMRNKWDRTLLYRLNYSHALLVKHGYNDKVADTSTPNCQAPSGQNGRLNKGTNTTTKRTNNTYEKKVGTSKKHAKQQSKRKTGYREEHKKAREWLEKQDRDFQSAANTYVEEHCNKPNVSYPIAFKMKIQVEIWRKYTEQDHHTSFDYVDKRELLHMGCADLTPTPVIEANNQEEYMEKLYKQGGMYG